MIFIISVYGNLSVLNACLLLEQPPLPSAVRRSAGRTGVHATVLVLVRPRNHLYEGVMNERTGPTEPGRLVGRGKVLKVGKRLATAEGEGTQDGKLVAKAVVSFAITG